MINKYVRYFYIWITKLELVTEIYPSLLLVLQPVSQPRHSFAAQLKHYSFPSE